MPCVHNAVVNDARIARQRECRFGERPGYINFLLLRGVDVLHVVWYIEMLDCQGAGCEVNGKPRCTDGLL